MIKGKLISTQIKSEMEKRGDIDVCQSDFLLDNCHLVANAKAKHIYRPVLSTILYKDRSVYSSGSVRL